MKYTTPKYELNSIETNDIITASTIQANNCTITETEGTFTNETITQVSGFFNSMVRTDN